MEFFSRKPLSLHRVVVTGMGLLAPTGKTVAENWQSIRSGIGGIARITHFDASEYATQIGGEVKGYDAGAYFDRKEIRKYDPYVQFALIASEEAVRDAALDLEKLNKDRCGVYIGSGIGGIYTIEANYTLLRDKGPMRVSPFFLASAIGNLGSGNVSIRYGFRGPNFANCTACATSTHAIGDSFKVIQRGAADLMLAGGSEYPITPLGISGFSVMRAMSTRNQEPEKASRPFDRERDGFVIAEGAGILILESLEHAHKRGAKIYAEIVGYGCTADAFHVTAPDPEGDGARRSMEMAMADAGISASEVAYINAHGTSTPLNDRLETKAIKALFGDQAAKLAVSSTKSMTGHLLGATGAAEGIFTVMAIVDSFLPPTINYEFPDPECDLNYVPNQGVSREVTYALSNTFGFGGTNGTLLFKKYVP